MAGEWREFPLSEAVLVNPPVRLEHGSRYPFVDMGTVSPESRWAYATEEREFSGGGSRFQHGDTLMARITPCLENGKIARFHAREDSGVGHGSTEFIVIRGRSGITDTDFAYYLIQWEEVRRYAVNHMTGTSGRQRVPTDSFDHLIVPLPPLPEQRAIAHILGTLDDKIELNRRMSQTLEAMARALFKSWFIDFEPVRAKMEGRWKRGQSLPGLPAHLWDLFPARLVDSELGEIPEGWGVARMNDVLAEIVSGGRPKGGAVEEGVPSVGAENVIGLGKYDFSKEKYIPRKFFEQLQRKGAAVRPGDVLLYKDGAQIGRKTYFDCGFPHTECAVNEHVFILRARHPRYQRYLFFWLDQEWMTQEIISLNSNSAQPGINQQGVRTLHCLIAPNPVLDAFDRFSKPLMDHLFFTCIESRTLVQLRDTLLPKLISGEIRVKDAERFLEERGL